MNFPYFLYGGDYNPDQWPSEIWQGDARLMQDAGVNLVSLGIFSYVKMEPKSGVFNFAWLDQLIDLLHVHGVSDNLATPTASAPAWIIRQHPENLPVTADCVTLWHGARRHYCPHKPDYLKYAVRIAQQFAERYKDHPALKTWHVDNEYSCHADGCYCDNSAAAFRAWLQERYGTLDHLNAAWGTAFWSQAYGDWEEIYPPRKSPAQVNPTQQLDWARFTSDLWLVCFNEQKAVLKAITPNITVTTNFMGFHKGVDNFKFARHEEHVAQDTYPDTFDPERMIQAGMLCDLIRSVGERRPWVLMEQASSKVNWRERNAAKRPGVMRLGSYQAVARGADGIIFFQWRVSKAGAEKHHSGMVPHGGTDTRVWREVKGLGNEFPKMSSLLQSQVKAAVAILMDWNNWWALELDSKPSSNPKMHPQLYTYYRPYSEHNIAVDFAHPESDLSKYKLVIAPNLYLVHDAAVKNNNQYVKNGGNLVKSFFSGIVDEYKHIRLGGYPATYHEILGLSVEGYATYSDRQTNTIRTADGNQFHCTFWADVIHLKSTKALATFEQDYYSGGAAITHNQFGKGNAFYIGSQPDGSGIAWLLSYACITAGVQSRNLPAGIELLQRSKGTSTWLFVLNHSTEKVTDPLEQKGKDLLTGTEVIGSLKLEPKGVAVIQVDRG
nr:beta-galactosidase [uncultured bacterium]